MTIETTTVGKAAVVKLIGRMDAETCRQFEAAWDRLMGAGSINLVVDLSELTYLNSAGIGSFLRNGKLAQSKGGALLIVGLKGLVKEIFELTQLHRVYPIFDSTEAALKSIA
jgi:anti-anti-sigma factor